MFIVTGASDGLGLAIAKLLTSKGRAVVCLSRTQPKSERINWVRVDLTDETSITNAAEELLGYKDKFEALINCAAVTSYENMESLTPKELDRMFKTNVIAPMLLTSKLLGRIKQDVADVVNIGATIALKSGYAGQATYSTTKWALRGFTQNLIDELKPTGCRVISFLLGGFNSRMHEKVTGEAIADPQNWMKPEDIAVLLLQLLELPKNMEISEIIVNRKSRR